MIKFDANRYSSLVVEERKKWNVLIMAGEKIGEEIISELREKIEAIVK